MLYRTDLRTARALPGAPMLLVLALLATGCRADVHTGDANAEDGAAEPAVVGAVGMRASDDPVGSDLSTPLEELTLPELERLWSAQRYAEVLPLLIEYRSATAYGKNEVVDYMIGTSACRVPEHAELGHRMLAWVLARYSLNEESRQMVRAELQRCPPAARLIPVSLSLVGVGPASTSGTRGKMFYYTNRGEDVPVANEPVVVHRVVPQEELERRLYTPARGEEAATATAGRAGDGFRAITEGSFVLASRTHSDSQLRGIARGLTHFLDFFAAEYEIPRPPHLVTVYLAGHAGEMRQLAERLHGIGLSPMSIGYSFRDDLSMVGIVPGEIYGTLAHELFHLMVRRDFGDVPPWLDEGLAALYEVSRVEASGRVRGLSNWRGPVLRDLWEHRPSLDELVRADWSDFEAAGHLDSPVRQAASHATARYFVLFLQERGLLTNVYQAIRERSALTTRVDAGADAIATLERLTGKSMSELDAEFVEWFEQNG